ncbi:MAG: hypothetical protein OHK93_002286 [Ramalina farinacea]|uniref:Integral membrane protein n=1 Tax=Ramalina farinacea TaxID=258253 RepID=A0AA43QR61_9LECA|nr:hypothetical protein [Ramalina farinacea]
MGKAGRFACIFTPMALTIGSLVCLIIVGLGGTNRHNNSYNNLYFFRANTSNINISPSDIPNLPTIPGVDTDALLNATEGIAKSALGIGGFYHISLWNYCEGSFVTNNTGSNGGSDYVTYCSPHTNEFWFNPVDVWKLNNTGVDKFFSKELKSGLDTYKTVAKWMFIAYIVALIATIVEILVGFLALFSRLGSVLTTVVSTVSSLFILAFALTATILYSTLDGTFNTALNKYDIHGSLGKNIYVATWLGVVFSMAAGLFWLFSSCCCSGRSDRIKGYNSEPKGNKQQGGGFFGRKKMPYNYERMGSPFEGGLPYNQANNGHQLGTVGNQRGTAYEPFRHGQQTV